MVLDVALQVFTSRPVVPASANKAEVNKAEVNTICKAESVSCPPRILLVTVPSQSGVRFVFAMVLHPLSIPHLFPPDLAERS